MSTTINDKDFKLAMSKFPSGVVIATTINNENKRQGFTASAFSSLSLEPPLILVCLANSADCFNAFSTTNKFAVNILGKEQEDLAMKFATKGIEKFSDDDFDTGSHGLPIIPDCVASLECDVKNTFDGGDHTILVGEVKFLSVNDVQATIWHQGSFNTLAEKK